VKTLLSKLSGEGLIGEDPRNSQRLFLTDKGKNALEASGRIAIHEANKSNSAIEGGKGTSLQGDKSGDKTLFNDTEIELRKQVLHEVRNSLADQNNIAPFAVFSEDALRKMAITDIKETTDLAVTGLSTSRIEKYGRFLVGALREMSSSHTPSKPSKSEGPVKTNGEIKVEEIVKSDDPVKPETKRQVSDSSDDPGLPF
jgi:superfamily II DNA helicase RecQ